MGTLVECMTIELEYDEVKFNLHQDRNIYFLTTSDPTVDFDKMLAVFAKPGIALRRLRREVSQR